MTFRHRTTQIDHCGNTYFCTMRFIDTHAHIFMDRFDDDRDAVIDRALAAGVDTILMPNIDADSITPMMTLHRKYPKSCLPMMGLHPTSVDNHWEQITDKMTALFTGNTFVAVGETGLDLYWDKSQFDAQKDALACHLLWARTFNLPVVLHVREAFSEVFEVLDKFQAHELSGVFHCFSGGGDELKYITEHYPGFYFGIGGVLTFKNGHLRDLVALIPEDKIILETDAPFLTPVPHRGKRNEPAFIPCIAAELSRITQKPLASLARQSTSNAKALFKIS